MSGKCTILLAWEAMNLSAVSLYLILWKGYNGLSPMDLKNGRSSSMSQTLRYMQLQLAGSQF